MERGNRRLVRKARKENLTVRLLVCTAKIYFRMHIGVRQMQRLFGVREDV